MSSQQAFALVGAWFISTVCFAGAPAGPEAAEEILQQNPQIKTLAGVPGNLKGVGIKDCPAGGNPDISKNRCVVVSAPASATAKPYESNYGVAQSYVLILHLNSPKVWGVFKTDATDKTKTALVGQFDLNGRLLRQGAVAADAKGSKAQAKAAGPASVDAPQRQESNATTADRGQSDSATTMGLGADGRSKSVESTGQPSAQTTGTTRDPSAWLLTTRGFGPIKLGMTPGDATRAAGGRLGKHGSDGGSDMYSMKGLSGDVTFFTCTEFRGDKPGPRRFGEIQLFVTPGSPRLATDKGIKVRDPASRVVQAYGTGLRKEKDDHETVYIYTDPQDPSYSLAFRVPNSGEQKGLVSLISARWNDARLCSA